VTRSRAALAIVATTFLACPAYAEPEKRIAVGIVLTDDIPRGDARSGVRIRPMLRLHNKAGLHPAFGFNWVPMDLAPDTPGDPTSGHLHVRPLLAGVSYTWIIDKLSVSPRVFAGYSINTFRRDSKTSYGHGPVAKAELQLFRDLTPRLGVVWTAGYLVARPEVAGRTVKADEIRVQVGLAFAVF
jgi:hypothetical protein